MYIVDGTVFIQTSCIFGRIIIIIISRSDLKLGHVVAKTRSLGKIFGKSCVHSRGYSFDPKFIKLCPNVNSYNIYNI